MSEDWQIGDTFFGRGGGTYRWTVTEVCEMGVYAKCDDDDIESRFFNFDQIERRCWQ